MQWSHSRGLGSQAGGGDVSLSSRDHAGRRMHEETTGTGGREATGRRVSVGAGTGRGRVGQLLPGAGGQQVSTPLQMCKRGREKARALEEQDHNVGTPRFLPQPDPHPVRKLETSGKCTGVGGQTDTQTRREH